MSLSAELAEHGISIRDDFLSIAQMLDLVACLEARRARGDFSGARIGAGRSLQRREDLRGDSTCWLSEPLYEAEVQLLESLEQLRLELNRVAFLGLLELELHYAVYPPGTGYARHVDQPRAKTRRKVSLVLYLNRDWQLDDGGELRIYGAGDAYLGVRPVGGRLVCFLTADREHCVLPAQRERISVTGWFGARD